VDEPVAAGFQLSIMTIFDGLPKIIGVAARQQINESPGAYIGK
jgi:hypothetical protein